MLACTHARQHVCQELDGDGESGARRKQKARAAAEIAGPMDTELEEEEVAEASARTGSSVRRRRIDAAWNAFETELSPAPQEN